MFDELLDVVIGPWGIAAAILLGTAKGRQITKKAAKEVIKGGLIASEYAREFAAQAQEQASDLLAEAKAERSVGNGKH